MPASVWGAEVSAAFAATRSAGSRTVDVGGRPVEISTPFPSPGDWRDHPIYQILVDRFANPDAKPNHPWDRATGEFQGGTFEGIRQRLGYLQELGVGAL